MPHQTPILLIGGTRGTGRLIANLLARDRAPVRILARNPDRAARELGSGADIVRGDITKLESLRPAIAGARDIIFTAGCRSGRPVSERTIRSTEYDGVLNTLAVARETGFAGCFLYMTASGVGTPRYRIARADVAELFLAALAHPRTARATFEIFARTGRAPSRWPALFDAVLPDDASPGRSSAIGTHQRRTKGT